MYALLRSETVGLLVRALSNYCDPLMSIIFPPWAGNKQLPLLSDVNALLGSFLCTLFTKFQHLIDKTS